MNGTGITYLYSQDNQPDNRVIGWVRRRPRWIDLKFWNNGRWMPISARAIIKENGELAINDKDELYLNWAGIKVPASSLPIASKTSLGIVRIGDNLNITPQGLLSAEAGIKTVNGNGPDSSGNVTIQLFPEGPAGGVLSGNYPNPSFAKDIVNPTYTNSNVALNFGGTFTAVTSAITDGWTGLRIGDSRTTYTLPTLPTGLPPSGVAGGDLTGTYPNPNLIDALMISQPVYYSLNAGDTFSASSVNVDTKGRVTHHYLNNFTLPSTYPLGGTAGGDLVGTYPNPTLATVLRSNTTSSTAPGSGGTFTTIDSITTDAKGRVTTVNTKTVTMPTSSGGGGGTVTQVNTGTGLTGGPITSTGTISLAGFLGQYSFFGLQVTFVNNGSDSFSLSSSASKVIDPDGALIIPSSGHSYHVTIGNQITGGNSMSHSIVCKTAKTPLAVFASAELSTGTGPSTGPDWNYYIPYYLSYNGPRMVKNGQDLTVNINGISSSSIGTTGNLASFSITFIVLYQR
jgi:hypothetical protein